MIIALDKSINSQYLELLARYLRLDVHFGLEFIKITPALIDSGTIILK